MKVKMTNREFPYLFAWSSSLLLSAAIVLRILNTLLYACFLHLFSISFKYTPLNIKFSTEGFGNWTIESMVIVYVFTTVILLVFGLILVRFLKIIRPKNLKVRLFLTWLAFLSTHLLATNMVAGAGIYAEFGIAYSWLIKIQLIRIIFALLVIGIFLFFRSFWIKLFLQTSYSFKAVESHDDRKSYIKVAFILPVLSASVILAIYAYSVSSLFWFISFISYWLIAFPVINQSIPYFTPRLVKTSDTYVFRWVTGVKMLGWLIFFFIIAFLRP